MDTNDLNYLLYEKMSDEQDIFRDWLKSLPREEMLYHAYEYSVREDIVMAMENMELTDAQILTNTVCCFELSAAAYSTATAIAIFSHV